MNNPFEGKAIRFETKEQLDHLAELAKGYGLETEYVKFGKGIWQFVYFRKLSDEPKYTNCYNTNGNTEIHYYQFVADIDVQKFVDSRNPKSDTPTLEMVNHPSHTILDTAKSLIYGDREKDYGKTSDNFADIAKGWEVITKATITPEQVGLMMAWLKICRANKDNCEKRDSLVDLAGYAGCIEKIKKNL